jgi:hypothetical protein
MLPYYLQYVEDKQAHCFQYVLESKFVMHFFLLLLYLITLEQNTNYEFSHYIIFLIFYYFIPFTLKSAFGKLHE